MEQIKDSVKNCKDIINAFKKIDEYKLQKLYEFNFISKDDTLDILKRINSIMKFRFSSMSNENDEYENLTEIELYEIIITKLEAMLILYNDLRNGDFYYISGYITKKKKFIDDYMDSVNIDNIIEYIQFYEGNDNIIKCEDLSKDKKNILIPFYGIKQIEPIDDRTTVMILSMPTKIRESELTNVLLPKEFNRLKTYKYINNLCVALYENKKVILTSCSILGVMVLVYLFVQDVS